MTANLQKLGGIAALIEATLYITGFALFLTVLSPTGIDSTAQRIAFFADNALILSVANLLIYVVFGVVLVVLAVALHNRLSGATPAMMQVATSFGLIWSGLVIASGMIANIGNASVFALLADHPDQAESLWWTLGTVQEALGGGNEIVGGLWALLVSWAALRSDLLPKALNGLGILVGLAGILTALPPLGFMAEIFGLGQIVWFAALGIVMLRTAPETS